MGRPPLPPEEARSEVAKVRLTPGEAQELAARYGTPGAALRALVEAALVASGAPPAPPARPRNGRTTLPTTTVTTPVTTEVRHRHRRDFLVRDEWRAGRKIEVWQCSCGQELAAT